MHYMRLKRAIGLVVLITIAGLAPASIPVRAADNNHAPDLPTLARGSAQVPRGNKATCHVYPPGPQIYQWNGASGVSVEPVATASRQSR